MAPGARRGIVRYYLDQVWLTPFATAYPHQLSSGMKQRVSIARAFATDPEILLMDEPFAAVDERNKLLLQQELLRIRNESRKTVVFITHSIDEAVALGDRVLVMTAQPGKTKRVVPVEPDPAHARPRPRAHRGRCGAMMGEERLSNRLDGRARRRAADGVPGARGHRVPRARAARGYHWFTADD